MASLDLAGIITRICADLKNYFAQKTELAVKQDKLVDGVNIKTVDSHSLLGTGNLSINTDTTAYKIRFGDKSLVTIERGYGYRLWLTSANGENLVPINTSTSMSTATTKALNTRPIDPFGLIIYNNTSYGASAATNIGAYDAWKQYPKIDIRYSYVITLTTSKPIYLKCTPQADGSAVMADIVQALPSSKDGKIYIFLGVASSSTDMELYLNHPVYYHDGSGIRLWRGGFGSAPETITFANLCSNTWHYNTIGSLADTSAGIYYMPDRGHYTTGDVTYNDIRTAIQSTDPAAFINRLKSISPFDIESQHGIARFDLYIEPGVQNDVEGDHPATVEYLHVLMTDTDATTYQYTIEFDYYRYTAIDNDFGDWEYDAKYGEVIPVANGGTGATTASGARTNLDVPGLNTANRFHNNSQFIKLSDVDTSLANNGVSAVDYHNFGIVDKNEKYLLFCQSGAMTDGSVRAEFAARNLGTGANVSNILRLTVNNDGSREVYVTEKAPWWAGLGLDTWATVALSDFATAATGWAFATSSCNIQYNDALKALRVRIQIAPSSAQTAGQKTLFTVKTAYRPKTFAASISSITSNAQAGQLYTSGGFAVNIVAINANTNLYFNGVYFIGA